MNELSIVHNVDTDKVHIRLNNIEVSLTSLEFSYLSFLHVVTGDRMSDLLIKYANIKKKRLEE